MTSRAPHGVAGMLIVLFALAGVAFSYGLGGHAPPLSICVVHLGPDQKAPAGPGVVAQDQAHSPFSAPDRALHEVGLSLAVLLTLMVLALAAAPRRAGALPRRFGWTLSPPACALPRPRSLAVLQVLRL